MSHDLEDIIAVIDGRAELLSELSNSDGKLQEFVSSWFSRLLEDHDFCEALPGYLPADSASQQRLPVLMERLKILASTR